MILFLRIGVFALPLYLHAQTTATLTGQILDPSGGAVGDAVITVENSVTKYHTVTRSAADGSFTVRNIPYAAYDVRLEHPGFQAARRQVALRTNVPFVLEVRLQLAAATESVTVSGSAAGLLVDPAETGTHTQMDQSDIDRISQQVGSRGLESVLVTFPGFAKNANGAIHPRGAHNQMTFVIDGMPISDQLTGAFANAVDPNIVQTVELFTGNIPAEYGSKVSAVANVTTRSGLGSGRHFGGSVSLNAARFDLLSQVTQVAGETGKVGYSAIVNTMKTNRYLDAVSLDNLHNAGNSERGFLRLDYQAGPRDVMRLNGMVGRSSFQLANLRSQHAAGMDQRQMLRDASGSFTWVHTVDARTTWDTTTSYRTTDARLYPSGGDSPVTAAQARHLSTVTTGGRFSTLRGAHSIRAGFDVQRFPVSESFAFGITDPAFNHPEDRSYNPNLLPYDLARGGRLFSFSARDSGGLYSGFLQDNVRLGRFQFTLGLRHDWYRFLVAGSQWQPRVGAAFHIRETGTVLRASYNRLYQTPPNENLLLSSSEHAASIAPPAVVDALGSAVVRIRPERQNFLEAGVQQALGGRASLNVSYYHKQASDQQDNNNFLNTGIIFPITLASIRVNAVECRLVVPPVRGVSGTLSVTHAKAVSTPPFTGGLYIGNDAITALTAGPFVIDHDQPLAIHGTLTYAARSGFYSSFSARYDSGLVANPSDPAEVAADSDYADLLPYVNLTGYPPRVRSRTVLDTAAGYERTREGKRRWDASVQVSNLTNRVALYNFQSAFVGTRLVQPFTAGVRLRWYF